MDYFYDTPFRLIAEYTYDWETWVDGQGVARWVNAAVERITGYRVEQCLARSDYPLGFAYEDDRPVLARVLADAAAGGSGNDVEFRVRRSDGVLRWVAISWQSVRSDSGELLGYRTSVRDIEERKRVEAELHVMRKRAEAAAVARSELLANVSHELRSPVHCIAGFTGLLLDTKLDAEQRRYLELIESECTGMVRQVEDLLQLAAIEAGGARLEQRAFDLSELVRGVVEVARPIADARKLEIVTELSLPDPWLLGDPTRIGQVLRNLLDNALKFTERGHVRVVARALSRAEADGDPLRIELSVHDTGVGIDPQDVARLLEPFQQASGATTRRHGGVGLGLSIVQRLVSAMQGTLQIEGVPGSGTSVRVELPLIATAPKESVPVAPRGPTHRGETALVVDDSAPARELLRAMLERSGYRVVEAESSRAAVERFEESEFDLVLLDYQMPDADGTETALALRRVLANRPESRKTSIFLLTANVFARERVAANAAIDGILEKPLSRAELEALLNGLGSAGSATGTQRVSSLLDARVLADLMELKTQTGEPILLRLLKQTQEAQERDMALLAEAVSELDQAAIVRRAHDIAGHAAVLGARDVANRARALEDLAAAGELSQEEGDRRAHALRRAWSRSMRALRQFANPES